MGQHVPITSIHNRIPYKQELPDNNCEISDFNVNQSIGSTANILDAFLNLSA